VCELRVPRKAIATVERETKGRRKGKGDEMDDERERGFGEERKTR
jgi:hypothetical protein